MRNQFEDCFIVADGAVFREYDNPISYTRANPICITTSANLNGIVRDIDRYTLVDIYDAGKPVDGFLWIIIKEAEPNGRCNIATTGSSVRLVISESFAAHIGGELSLRAEAMQYHFRDLGL